MPTKTFSGRADERLLAYADALTQREYDMSFGQYCGSMLVEAVFDMKRLPELAGAQEALGRKEEAIATIRGFSERPHNADIGRMTDGQLRDLIASRYE